jgi:hypothetical protein
MVIIAKWLRFVTLWYEWYAFRMTEIIINTTEVRRDIGYVETMLDLSVVQWEADYLADEATARLEFALIEANEMLLAIRALKGRLMIQEPTEL